MTELMTTLDLEIPAAIPTRNAVAALRHHIVEQIVRHRPAVGTSLMSAEAMAEHFGVSRSTMNRVLECLQREGWIERRVGHGTFVGPRAEYAMSAPSPPASLDTARRMVRLAVTVAPEEHDVSLWHTQGLLDGIDRVVAEGGVSIELVGRGKDSPNNIGKRIAQSSPDALILMKPHVVSGSVIIFEARRLQIPVFCIGTRMREFECTTVQENGEQGVADAVEYLARHGHRRIGFAVPDEPVPLWFDRRHGYQRGMAQAKLPFDQNLIHWHPANNRCFDLAESLFAYLKQVKPTALILATGVFTEALVPLVQSGRLKLPDDLSIVVFDQIALSLREMLGGVAPTIIELPVQEMGAQAVRLCRLSLVGQQVPKITSVPCRLVEGQSVRSLN